MGSYVAFGFAGEVPCGIVIVAGFIEQAACFGQAVVGIVA
jgi:hypothetical protein